MCITFSCYLQLTFSLCWWRVVSEQDCLLVKARQSRLVLPLGRVGDAPLPVLHDVGKGELLVLLNRLQEEVLRVEVDHRVQEDLGAVGTKLKVGEVKSIKAVHDVTWEKKNFSCCSTDFRRKRIVLK